MPEGFWTVYWAFVAFVFGAIVGSFLNVCVWRLPRGESLSHPPSHCPGCGHTLRFLPDMVPILSQLRYRSRCRYCGERFSWRYLWVEVFTALLFTALYLRGVPWGNPMLSESLRNLAALCGMGFAAALMVVFFIDLEHYEIPDIAILVAVVCAVGKDAVLIAAGARPLWQQLPGLPFALPVPLSLLTGLLAFWLLWQFAALTTAALGREAMGAGDSLLLAAMGAFLIPWPLVLVAFMVAVLLGTIGGVAGMLLYREPAAPEESPSRHGDTEPEGTEPDGSQGADTTDGPDPPEPTDPADEAEDPDWCREAQAADPGGAEHAPGSEASGEVEPPEPPALPPASRWGRLVTVAGSWLGVGSLWIGAAAGAGNPALGVAAGLGAAAVAGGVLHWGIRTWVTGDREWLPAMDALFEDGDPGPRFIPFGPYLVVGTFVAYFAGRWLIESYAASVDLALPPLPWE